MKCLIGYVGLKVCEEDSDPPGSGLYINSLPGISLELIDKTASNDQITYAQLWIDAQNEAWVRFVEDFIAAVSECYQLTKDCNYENLICANKKRLVNPWRYLLGNQLMLYRKYTERLNKFTLTNREASEELKDFYQAEYLRLLGQAVQLIDITPCKCVLVQDPTPRQVQYLP